VTARTANAGFDPAMGMTNDVLAEDALGAAKTIFGI
jgi:hypothetical protein